MKRRSKNLLVLIVLLAIIGIAVGYAALSQNLTLNGTAILKNDDWDIHFVEDSAHVVQNSAIYNDAKFSLNSGNLTGKFDTTIAPGEMVIYEVDVVNDGTIPGTLDRSGVQITGETTNIKCNVVGPDGENSIADGTTHHYEIEITCEDMDALPEQTEVANITVTFPYVQATTVVGN